MKTKYIKGTNKKYSIREDGVVFIHYRIKRITNTRKDKISCYDKVSTYNNSVNLRFSGIIKTVPVHTLLFNCFSYKFCNQCGSKFVPDISPLKCNNCRRKNRKHASLKYTRKWTKNNPELVKEYTRNKCINLTRDYISGALGIKTNELTDDLYNHHKNLILLKRKIAKENQLNIQAIK